MRKVLFLIFFIRGVVCLLALAGNWSVVLRAIVIVLVG